MTDRFAQRSIFEKILEQRHERVDDARLNQWMADERARVAGHPSAVPECEGCSAWGLCGWHAPPAVPGLAARTAEQADAWRRGGYEPAARLAPLPIAEPQDLQEQEHGADE